MSLGSQPDNMEEWMRAQSKRAAIDARKAGPNALLGVATAHRLDRLAAAISLPNAAAGDGTDVVLGTNVIDTLGNWLAYSASTGHYTAVAACILQFTGDFAFASSATGGRAVRLWWRPTGAGTWYEQVSFNNAPGIGGTYTVFMPVEISLAIGDQVKFTARQNSGGALDLLGATTWPAAVAGNYSSQVAVRLVTSL